MERLSEIKSKLEQLREESVVYFIGASIILGFFKGEERDYDLFLQEGVLIEQLQKNERGFFYKNTIFDEDFFKNVLVKMVEYKILFNTPSHLYGYRYFN
jgi:hypothetical protein